MDITLQDIERLLAMPVPSSYAEIVGKYAKDQLVELHYDPKTVCVLNLDTRSIDQEGWSADKFLIAADGLGNYFYIDGNEPEAKILLWSHDPPGIEETNQTVDEFINTFEQEFWVLCDPQVPVCISKTTCVGESALDPITINEWKGVISETESVRYNGIRELKNPFTDEIIKVDSPGYAVGNVNGTEFNLELNYGRIEIRKSPGNATELFESLAKKLGAEVYYQT